MTAKNNQNNKYQSLSYGLGVAGLITSILTLVISFIPCFGIFAFTVGIISVLISFIGLAISLKHGYPKGLIIAALITAFLGCAIAYSQYSAMKEFGDEVIQMQGN